MKNICIVLTEDGSIFCPLRASELPSLLGRGVIVKKWEKPLHETISNFLHAYPDEQKTFAEIFAYWVKEDLIEKSRKTQEKIAKRLCVLIEKMKKFSSDMVKGLKNLAKKIAFEIQSIWKTNKEKQEKEKVIAILKEFKNGFSMQDVAKVLQHSGELFDTQMFLEEIQKVLPQKKELSGKENFWEEMRKVYAC